jgi:hypothetical protein
MDKLHTITIVFILLISNVLKSQTTETLIYYDYIESYDWMGAWWYNNPTTGYYSNISVTPTLSAVLYGDGNTTNEQDFYVLPAVTVDPTKDHIFRMKLAAQVISSPGASTKGLDGGDYITVQLSQDGGSYVSELRVAGFSNAIWDYSSTAVASKVADGSLTQFRPNSGGDRTSTGDGYSNIELIIPAGPTTIAIDIQTRANRPGEDWWMDNFELFEVTTLLPVELLSFDVTPINNQYARLEWVTASEINNDGFEVLRSTDGENFKVIGWVNGNGNQTTITEYTYEDYSIEKGITYYYQLKQIDYDGQYEYFNIEPLTLTDINLQKPISVKRVNILGQEDVNGNMIIEIYDNRIVKKMIIK